MKNELVSLSSDGNGLLVFVTVVQVFYISAKTDPCMFNGKNSRSRACMQLVYTGAPCSGKQFLTAATSKCALRQDTFTYFSTLRKQLKVVEYRTCKSLNDKSSGKSFSRASLSSAAHD